MLSICPTISLSLSPFYFTLAHLMRGVNTLLTWDLQDILLIGCTSEHIHVPGNTGEKKVQLLLARNSSYHVSITKHKILHCNQKETWDCMRGPVLHCHSSQPKPYLYPPKTIKVPTHSPLSMWSPEQKLLMCVMVHLNFFNY